MHWSPSEKKLARTVFQQALQQELAELLAEFKAKAAAVSSMEEMWAIRDYLERVQQEIERKYDFRYSELLFVFGRLLQEGRIGSEQLSGLSEDKRDFIHDIVSLWTNNQLSS